MAYAGWPSRSIGSSFWRLAADDRRQAGERLAALLEGYRGKDAVVLAIPRGGVVVRAVVAERLGLKLDVILTKKLGHPLQPEFAIGVVNLEAAAVDSGIIARDGISRAYVDREVARIRRELRRRHALYRGDAKAPPETAAALEKAADELVCPLRPESFFAIGQFYDSFEQVEDSEAIRLLRRGGPAAAR